jgi:hypothetical protein
VVRAFIFGSVAIGALVFSLPASAEVIYVPYAETVAKTVSVPTFGYRAKTVYVAQTVYEPATTYVDQTVYETQYRWRAVETAPTVVAAPVVAYWHPGQYYAASAPAPAPERVKVAHHRQHRKVLLAAN